MYLPCTRVSATEGRRHGQEAHLARQLNEKPADAKRCRDIIESNLPNRNRAECEEGSEK